MNYAAQLMALIVIKEKQANFIGLVCFFFFVLWEKVVFDSWERNGIEPKFNLDLFFSGF